VLNRVLPALVVLLAACSVPARDRTPPRDESLPARPTETVPLRAIVVAEPAAPAHAEASSPTRALFLANCAQCHGEKGDGLGVTQLDRKARSFLDGGFSYGNTRDAILRSITHGIPGTPMPAFEKALNESQRVELAQYVIAFGPDQIVVDPSESEVVVRDRPVIVRGRLPAIVEGASEWPRGIAIGTPEGLTFEYRADEVQLVGVRAGRFLNRTDWGERGGTGLEMLGQPVWSSFAMPGLTTFALGSQSVRSEGMQGVITRSEYVAGVQHEFHARLFATSVRDGRALVEYELTAKVGDEVLVHVTEECQSFRCSMGSGFVLRSELRARRADLCVETPSLTADTRHLSFGNGSVALLPGSKPVLVFVRTLDKAEEMGTAGRIVVPLDTARAVVIERFVMLDLLMPVSLDGPESPTIDRLIEVFRR